MEKETERQAEKIEKLFPCKRVLYKEKSSGYVFQILKLPEKLLSYRKFASRIPQQKAKREVKIEGKGLFFICPREQEALGKSLLPERVKNWRLKEYLLASERLKLLGQKEDKRCVCKVTLIDKRPKQKDLPWEELTKHHEERQFQITRITKILSD